MTKALRSVGLLLWMVLAPNPMWAAGGAHVVDDSEVETPGLCHVDTWVAASFTSDVLFNGAPACTTTKIPWLEIGAAYNHYWGSLNAPLFGPAMKVNFRSEETGFGVGLGLNGAVNLKTGNLGFASTLLLVSWPIDDRVKFHANAGWSYLAGVEAPNALFYGGQVEIDVGRNVMLMLEAFGQAPGSPGTQMGLRYTPNKGPVDIDLLVATYFDSVTTRFITLGVSVRF
jgi:hypothetical protein